MTEKTRQPASFGAWLESQLIRREWNQSDLARRVGVRPSVVSRWVRDERIPSPPFVDKIADALLVDIDEALTRAGHRPRLPGDELDAIHARLDPRLSRVRWDEFRFRLIEGMLDQFLQDDELRRAAAARDTSP